MSRGLLYIKKWSGNICEINFEGGSTAVWIRRAYKMLSIISFFCNVISSRWLIAVFLWITISSFWVSISSRWAVISSFCWRISSFCSIISIFFCFNTLLASFFTLYALYIKYPITEIKRIIAINKYKISCCISIFASCLFKTFFCSLIFDSCSAIELCWLSKIFDFASISLSFVNNSASFTFSSSILAFKTFCWALTCFNNPYSSDFCFSICFIWIAISSRCFVIFSCCSAISFFWIAISFFCFSISTFCASTISFSFWSWTSVCLYSNSQSACVLTAPATNNSFKIKPSSFNLGSFSSYLLMFLTII